jgi:hypothetical protein
VTIAKASIAIRLILVETALEVELGRAPFVPNRLILHAYSILMTHTQALLTLLIVRAFTAHATTTPSADFCCVIRTPLDVLSHEIRDTQQISRDKFDRCPRTTAGFTTSALDGYGLPDCLLARPAP